LGVYAYGDFTAPQVANRATKSVSKTVMKKRQLK
jgi:hypothetical protein